ncbi:carbohydrate kinase family protein [Actinokineospora sp. NBRC 105648]|uniref:carbohydrate kinase family protein n=1 Tax=Actinokineospora sp. NBRC 105648 TaxID=3032206 RepID=UPI002553438D|nr:carbohydrate kinase family protein [Actinokineospora sp. NBRC 105648]
MREVMVVGAYYVDLVFSGVPVPRSGGEVFAGGFEVVPGGGFSPAMALRRLGHDVVWAASFGTDLFSREVSGAAERERLDPVGFVRLDGPLRSVTAVLSGPEDRTMVSFQDEVVDLALPELVAEHRPRVVVLPLLRYGQRAVEELRAVRESGVAVFLDCQDVPVTLATPTVREVLAAVEVFSPNEEEALRLTGAHTAERAARELARFTPTVVVKRGPAGAVAVRGDQVRAVSAPCVPVVDTTGAGDCFGAGFVHGMLTGADLRGCLAAGVACGSASVTGVGSSAAPTSAELAVWQERLPPG